MDKNRLIGISVFTVILLVLGSLSNVVGYQTVQSSNMNIINEEVSQKELLFQTISDIVNNREIQRIMFHSQISKGRFFDSDTKFSLFIPQILLKSNLRHMYHIGLMLSKIMGKFRMHFLMVEQYHLINPSVHKEITAVIENDVTFNGDITQLSTSRCDCENDNTTQWSYPVLCVILFPLYCVILAIWALYHILYTFLLILNSIRSALNCWWSSPRSPSNLN